MHWHNAGTTSFPARRQYRRAAAAETSHWVAGAMDEKVLQKVAADVRRELEPKLYSTVHEQVHGVNEG